jgi:hypothetical protein
MPVDDAFMTMVAAGSLGRPHVAGAVATDAASVEDA